MGCEEGNTYTVLGCNGHLVSHRYDCDGDIISVCLNSVSYESLFVNIILIKKNECCFWNMIML